MSSEVQHYNDDFATANPEDIKKYLKNALEEKIENALKGGSQDLKGVEHAMKMKDLLVACGLKPSDDRKVREEIVDMQLYKKHLIISNSTNGYWYAKTYQEFKEFADFIYSYIGDMSHKVKVMAGTAGEIFGQYYQPPLFYMPNGRK
jgi:hypothetical protein